MVDPDTALGAGLTLLASKDIIAKLLGPTADYIGEETKNLVEKANLNLSNIFRHAIHKLGRKIEQPGTVNPRILKQVWDEGRFVEDELAAEYFGGLLASARSTDGKDDRVLSLLSTVRDLSVFDLKLHYLAYTLIRRLFKGREFTVAVQEDRVKKGIFLPFPVYISALNLEDEVSAIELAAHSLITLIKHELIDHRFTMGPPEKLKSHCPLADKPGIILIPSFFGAELYLWAHGYSDRHINDFLKPDLSFDNEVNMNITEGTLPMVERDSNLDTKG